MKPDIDVKPDVDSEGSLNVKFMGDTWPKLEPIKFKPQLPVDPRQTFVDEPEDENEILRAQVPGVRLASTSSSAKSLPSLRPRLVWQHPLASGAVPRNKKTGAETP